jgi:hypothetical protein
VLHRHLWPATLIALSLLFASCAAGSAPTPTPRSVVNVLEGLALRGATIQQAVSGDAGCPSVGLHGNAMRLGLTLDESGDDYEVYLFRWRRPADFEGAAGEFRDCLAEFASLHQATDVEVLELAPWRAYGPAWGDDLSDVLEAALRSAGGR